MRVAAASAGNKYFVNAAESLLSAGPASCTSAKTSATTFALSRPTAKVLPGPVCHAPGQRTVWFHHRGGSEIEIAAAVRALFRDGLDHSCRFTHRLPVDTVVGSDHNTAVHLVVANT